MWFISFSSPHSIPLYIKTVYLSHEHMFYEHKKRQNYPTVILSLFGIIFNFAIALHDYWFLIACFHYMPWARILSTKTVSKNASFSHTADLRISNCIFSHSVHNHAYSSIWDAWLEGLGRFSRFSSSCKYRYAVIRLTPAKRASSVTDKPCAWYSA